MPQPASDHFVFAGGGTGGHLFPGLAVANNLAQMTQNARITFLTTNRKLDDQLLTDCNFRQVPQSVRPWRAAPHHWPAFAWHWFQSVAAARKGFQNDRPRAVLGLGGYAAGPAVVAAAQLGIPNAILNPDATPGKANRHLARRCNVVFQQWEASRTLLSGAKRVETVGCPIRNDFASADRQRGRQTFNLDPERKTLLVTGASQGARTINEALMQIWPAFAAKHPDWQLLHLTGSHDHDRVKAHYAQQATPATVVDFTNQMADTIAAADVVIARAGASTLAELCVLGRPAILLPYPYHRDQHQRTNALVLVERGAAVLIDDTRDADRNAAAIAPALETWCDDQQRAKAAEASKSLAQPDAAQRVAAWMLNPRSEAI